VVGAGNFPSRRMILQVPASAFRAVLKNPTDALESPFEN
jgi:hypothetical protein